jgi:hypothetical protein
MLIGFVLVAHENRSWFLAALGAMATFPALLWRTGASFQAGQRMVTVWKGLGLGGPLYIAFTRTKLLPDTNSLLVLRHEPSNWIPGRYNLNPNNSGLKVRATRRVYALRLEEPRGRSWTLAAWVWQRLARHNGRKLATVMNLPLIDECITRSRW